MSARKKTRKGKKSNPIYNLLGFAIIVLGAIAITLATGWDRQIMWLLNTPNEQAAATESDAATDEPDTGEPMLTQLDAPEHDPALDYEAKPEPTESTKPQPKPEPAAEVAPVDIIPARPAVDTEAMRLAELDKQSRALFVLSDNYYRMRGFDMAIAKLQEVIELGHPDWAQQARERITFIQSVQGAE